MFQMTAAEAANLRSRSVISRSTGGHGGRRFRPYVFTEQGIAMLSSVLRSRRAVHANVEIMRAFVQLRRAAISHDELWAKVNHLSRARPWPPPSTSSSRAMP